MTNVVPFQPPSLPPGPDGSAPDMVGLQVYVHTVMMLGDSVADCIDVIARSVSTIDPAAASLLSLLNELKAETAAVSCKLREVDIMIASWSGDVVFTDGAP